jgi:hypothetical protein
MVRVLLLSQLAPAGWPARGWLVPTRSVLSARLSREPSQLVRITHDKARDRGAEW